MKIRRIIFRGILLLFAVSLCINERVFSESGCVVVIIKSRNIGPYNIVSSSFKKELRGFDSSIKVMELDFEDEGKIDQIAAEIMTAKSNIVVTLGTPATKAVRQRISGIPVIYSMILDPLRSSIEPPGVAMDIPFETKLREFKKIRPEVKNVGLIYSHVYASAHDEIADVCGRLDLKLVSIKVETQQEISLSIEDILKESDCFLMIADPNIYLPKTTEQLLLSGIEKKVPIIGLSSSYAKAGALIAFDCDYEDLGKRTAEFVLKVINGDGQVLKETIYPRKILYSLNLRVAERIGIEFSEDIIRDAGEVFGR